MTLRHVSAKEMLPFFTQIDTFGRVQAGRQPPMRKDDQTDRAIPKVGKSTLLIETELGLAIL